MRTEGTPGQKKSQSIENTHSNARKGSGSGEAGFHLEELRDKGKKVLKRLIPSESIGRIPSQLMKLV